jgi:hypothetical protein
LIGGGNDVNKVALPLAAKTYYPGCGLPSGQVSYDDTNPMDPKFGASLYGIKPKNLPTCNSKSRVPCTFPFNKNKYSQYT